MLPIYKEREYVAIYKILLSSLGGLLVSAAYETENLISKVSMLN